MKPTRLLLLLSLILCIMPALLVAQNPAVSPVQMLGSLDALKGETVFRDKGCFGCHSYDGWGGMFGPDLGTNRIRGASPASLAAAMWNQAPSMWKSIAGKPPTLTAEETAALYSFFYSRLYFNDYPDSPHGEDHFKSRCAGCHDLRPVPGKAKEGPPVSSWATVRDPIALSSRMWNHSTSMLDRMNVQFKTWPRMSGQDVTDLVSYLWRLPEVAPLTTPFRFGNDQAGEGLFNARCMECHTMGQAKAGRIDLAPKLRRKTLPEMAADMWNHAPAMKLSTPGKRMPAFTEAEFRDLVTFLVIRPVFSDVGNPGKGSQVFQSKKCAECHEGRVPNTGAKPLTAFKGPFNAISMTTVLWLHGPEMLAKMKQAGIAWPRFKEAEMLDLLAFLNRKVSK